MNTFQAVWLGFVQGITEFLPISSSGHLFLLERYWQIESQIGLAIILHLVSLVAVIFVMRKRIWELLSSVVSSLPKLLANAYQQKKSRSPLAADVKFALYLIIATLSTVPIAGVLAKYKIYELSTQSVAILLILTGFLIAIASWKNKQYHHAVTPKPTHFILAGLVQGLAVLPGLSRAGIVMVALIFIGYSKHDSALIALLLSIPIILAAVLWELSQHSPSLQLTSEVSVAIVVCLFAAILTATYLLKHIQTLWSYFAYYCLLMGVFILWWN